MDRSKWEYKKLGDICKSINAGGTPSRGNSAYWNGDIPWVKIRDMNSKYVNSTEEFITEEGLNNSSAKLFEPGTILYSIFATIGAASILEIPATTNQAIAGIVLGDGCDRDFYYYYLTSLKTHFENISKGVAQNNINLSVLRNQKVVVPPISDQQRIVAELDCLNEMIAVKQEQLKEFDKLAQSIFYDMFGDPVENEKKWNKCQWKDVFDTKLGKMLDKKKQNPKDQSYPYLANANVQWGVFDLEDLKTMTFNEREEDLFSLKKDDLLICEGGESGRCAIWKEDNSIIKFQKAIHRARVKDKSQLIPLFVQFYLMELKQRGGLKNYISKATIEHLTGEKLNQIPVLLPPLSLQQQFADKISAIEAQKELVKQSIAETQALLDYTMDKYFG